MQLFKQETTMLSRLTMQPVSENKTSITLLTLARTDAYCSARDRQKEIHKGYVLSMPGAVMVISQKSLLQDSFCLLTPLPDVNRQVESILTRTSQSLLDHFAL